MKNKFHLFSLRKELYLLLLPVFFILHGFTENYFLLPVSDAFLLLFYYLAIIIILCLIFFFIFKSWDKASLFTFLSLAYHFLFGSIHDTIIKLIGSSFITRYLFIILLSTVLFAVTFY